MNGYPDRTNLNYLRNTNTSLFDFPRDDENLQNQAYERALTFMHYLYEQYGESFMRAIPTVGWMGMQTINQALAAVDPNLNWESAARGFAVANWLQTSTDSRYGYRVNITTIGQRRARPLRTYTNVLRPHDTVMLAPYGVGYIVFENPPQLSIRMKGRYRYRIMAIGHRGDEVDVMDFESGQPIEIGNGVLYDRVVLVLIELSNATQRMTWDLNDGISSVESETIASATRFVSVTPNPTSAQGEIAFATSGRSDVRLELFSPVGERVRTLVDGERLEPGTHRASFDVTGLPAGAYLARLSEGDRTTTHLVVVR
jgi:hypothetical protein